MSYRQTLRSFDRTIYLYMLAVVLVGFAIDGGIHAVLFNLYLLRLGYGPTFVGLTGAVGLLAFTLCSLPAGMVSERWGNRRMLVAGLSVMVVGSGMAPLAELVPPAWRGAWLLASYGVLNVGMAMYFINTAPFLMRIISAEQRNHVVSLQMSSMSLASFAGSLTGGLLPGVFAASLGASLEQTPPYRYPLILAAAVLIPATLAIVAIRPRASASAAELETESEPELTPVAFPVGLIGLLALVRLLQVAGIGTALTFFNVYMDADLRVPTAQIGLFAAIGRLLSAGANLSTPAVMERLGKRRGFIWASVAGMLVMLPLGLIPNAGVAGLAFIGILVTAGVRYSIFLVYSLELVSSRHRATVVGMIEMAAGLSMTVTALGGGYVIALLGYRTLFFWCAIISAIGTLVFWIYFYRRGGKYTGASPEAAEPPIPTEAF